MSQITTHVLDTAAGRPAAGIDVHLLTADDQLIASGTTDVDGRIANLGPDQLDAGVYLMRFFTGAYLESATSANSAFYPEVTVAFTVVTDGGHYHVPLLLSPFGYSTYRGS